MTGPESTPPRVEGSDDVLRAAEVVDEALARHVFAEDGVCDGCGHFADLPSTARFHHAEVAARAALAAVPRPATQPEDCGHPNHGTAGHDCAPFTPSQPAHGETLTAFAEVVNQAADALDKWNDDDGSLVIGSISRNLRGARLMALGMPRERTTGTRWA